MATSIVRAQQQPLARPSSCGVASEGRRLAAPTRHPAHAEIHSQVSLGLRSDSSECMPSTPARWVPQRQTGPDSSTPQDVGPPGQRRPEAGRRGAVSVATDGEAQGAVHDDQCVSQAPASLVAWLTSLRVGRCWLLHAGLAEGSREDCVARRQRQPVDGPFRRLRSGPERWTAGEAQAHCWL